jgi:NTP pyrophosphatase (non-canonical NTP hydrolase)
MQSSNSPEPRANLEDAVVKKLQAGIVNLRQKILHATHAVTVDEIQRGVASREEALDVIARMRAEIDRLKELARSSLELPRPIFMPDPGHVKIDPNYEAVERSLRRELAIRYETIEGLGSANARQRQNIEALQSELLEVRRDRDVLRREYDKATRPDSANTATRIRRSGLVRWSGDGLVLEVFLDGQWIQPGLLLIEHRQQRNEIDGLKRECAEARAALTNQRYGQPSAWVNEKMHLLVHNEGQTLDVTALTNEAREQRRLAESYKQAQAETIKERDHSMRECEHFQNQFKEAEAARLLNAGALKRVQRVQRELEDARRDVEKQLADLRIRFDRRGGELEQVSRARDRALRECDERGQELEKVTGQAGLLRVELDQVRLERTEAYKRALKYEADRDEANAALKRTQARLERAELERNTNLPSIERLLALAREARGSGPSAGLDACTVAEMNQVQALTGFAGEAYQQGVKWGNEAGSAHKVDTSCISAEIKKAIEDVVAERRAQEAKWGRQDHDPLYYGAILAEEAGEAAKEIVEMRAKHEMARPELRKELIQTAAVCVGFVECLDRGVWTWGK